MAAAVAFNLYHLSINPDVQAKACDELNEIFGDSERTPSIEDLNQMKFVEQCIKETLRLIPSVPLIARKLSEDAKLGKNTILKNNWLRVGLLTSRLKKKKENICGK